MLACLILSAPLRQAYGPLAAAGVALTCLVACSHNPVLGELPRCGGPVIVSVTGDAAPVISWTPRCRADYVAVGYAALNDVWWTYGLTTAGIGPGVRVGDSPPAAHSEVDLPLIRGIRYHAVVGWRRTDRSALELGTWGYVQFVH